MQSTTMRATTLVAAMTLIRISAAAQALPCSWPLETTGSGITNIAYPDTNATYWTMPINSERWQSILIEGTYPQSRFFSFISYISNGSVADNGNASLVDVNITADSGSTNPFVTSDSGPHNYTITVGDGLQSASSNFLPLGSTRLAWIIYRIYVPNKDLDRQAGVPLPRITVVGKDGRSHTLTECSSRNTPGIVANLIQDFLHQRLNVNTGLLQLLSGGTDAGITEQAQCQPTPLVSWIPENTGGYFPNPANKYIAVPGLCFSPGQILVVRGKAPTFPDTYNGGPVWEPAGSNLRYWSTCNNNQQVPYPVVACAADYQTKLDAQGYYTYVLSESDRRDPMATPSWIPPDATWLPWGSKRNPNILILRNMLPHPTFSNSVQAAIQNNCAVNNQRSNPTPRDQVVAGGECAHNVMQEYYPTAVYCSKQVFINEGWQGCLAAAESGR